eukprot:GEMP01063002.1.p1 GENE.GEMP01063002.1~~GEMP01063002.1.p1  ORF type:complete len:164 (+),score=39.83 GEMP01063002.1:194-685(+)
MLVFSTVGTTEFDPLITAVGSPECQKALKDRGFSRLRVQKGRGSGSPPVPASLSVACYDFKPSLKDDMKEADLIISHAGAGSVMESLRMKKALIIVVNRELMDNHQVELAEEMERNKFALLAYPETLVDTIKKADLSSLREYPQPDLTPFHRLIEETMGLSPV